MLILHQMIQARIGLQDQLTLSLQFLVASERKVLIVFMSMTGALLPKLDELKYIVFSTKRAVIGVAETRLDDSINNFETEIPNYHLEREDRNREGGGVCIYIRADLAYNDRTDLHRNVIESVWVDILLPTSKPILVGNCYCPPKQSAFVSQRWICPF